MGSVSLFHLEFHLLAEENIIFILLLFEDLVHGLSVLRQISAELSDLALLGSLKHSLCLDWRHLLLELDPTEKLIKMLGTFCCLWKSVVIPERFFEAAIATRLFFPCLLLVDLDKICELTCGKHAKFRLECGHLFVFPLERFLADTTHTLLMIFWTTRLVRTLDKLQKVLSVSSTIFESVGLSFCDEVSFEHRTSLGLFFGWWPHEQFLDIFFDLERPGLYLLIFHVLAVGVLRWAKDLLHAVFSGRPVRY